MPELRQLRIQLETIGVRGMAAVALRNRFHRRLATYELCRPLLQDARGLEIGGPSAIFGRGGIVPVYPLFEQLDNCDFAGTTIWHGDQAEGSPFVYDAERRAGRRMIRDATELTRIADGSYDAVLSSHTLEHVANPLRALGEWHRVVGEGGHLLLVVPHLENTIDHRRPVTTIEHLDADLARSTAEDDDTHVAEFVGLADLARDPERLSREELAERTRGYVQNRAIHHHTFDTELVVRVLDRARFELIALEPTLPFHVVALARAVAQPDNDRLLAASADWRRTSPFHRDRQPRGGPYPPSTRA